MIKYKKKLRIFTSKIRTLSIKIMINFHTFINFQSEKTIESHMSVFLYFSSRDTYVRAGVCA